MDGQHSCEAAEPIHRYGLLILNSIPGVPNFLFPFFKLISFGGDADCVAHDAFSRELCRSPRVERQLGWDLTCRMAC